MSIYAEGSTNSHDNGPLLAIINGREVTIPTDQANEYRRWMRREMDELPDKLTAMLGAMKERRSLERDPLAYAIGSILAP